MAGGLGIDYDDPDGNPIPDFKQYFDIFHENLKLRPGQQVHSSWEDPWWLFNVAHSLPGDIRQGGCRQKFRDC